MNKKIISLIAVTALIGSSVLAKASGSLPATAKIKTGDIINDSHQTIAGMNDMFNNTKIKTVADTDDDSQISGQDIDDQSNSSVENQDNGNTSQEINNSGDDNNDNNNGVSIQEPNSDNLSDEGAGNTDEEKHEHSEDDDTPIY